MKTGIVSAVSKKYTVKLRKYGRQSAVVKVINRNATNGNSWERDSEKKIRTRTESPAKEHHYSLPRKDTFTKYCRSRLRSRTDTPRKKAHTKRLKFDKDADTISKGYLNDNAIKYSLKEKTKVHIIDSVEAKWLKQQP